MISSFGEQAKCPLLLNAKFWGDQAESKAQFAVSVWVPPDLVSLLPPRMLAGPGRFVNLLKFLI
jgi:hypothetical protein